MIFWYWEKNDFPMCHKCHSSIYFIELPISKKMKNKEGYLSGFGMPTMCILPHLALCEIKCLWECEHKNEYALVERGNKKIDY